MNRRDGQVTDEYGRPVPGATIYVFEGNAQAEVTADADGLIPIAQPIVTDEFGTYSYYANVGFFREDTHFAGKLRYREVIPVGLDGLYPLDRPGKYFAFDAEGDPVASVGTGSDPDLRTDLAETTGAQLIGYERAGGVPQGVYHFIEREKTTPLEYGGLGTGAGDDKAAIQAAINTGKRVRLPSGFDFQTKGGIVVPSGSQIEGDGGTLAFDGTGTTHMFSVGAAAGSAAPASQIAFEGLEISCDDDVEFLHIIRLENIGVVTDHVSVRDCHMVYDPAALTGGDRWFVAGAGDGERLHFDISGNHTEGPMQLIGSGGGTGHVQFWNVSGNTIEDANSNAISFLSLGTLGKTCTFEDMWIEGNVIRAAAHTTLGIALGLDNATPDRNVNLRRIFIRNNDIDIAGSGVATADLWFNLGNLAAGMGGFDSVADTIVIEGNTFRKGVNINANAVAASAGQSKITNFIWRGGDALGGDIILASLANGALLLGPNMTADSPLRLGAENGRIYAIGGRIAVFNPASGDSEFDYRSLGIHYTGRTNDVADRVIQLNANAGKVQSAVIQGGSINSDVATPANRTAAVRTIGAGNPTAIVSGVDTSTAWTNATGKYQVDTGTITDTSKQPNVQTVATIAGLTPKTENDLVAVTALAANMTINNPTGQAPFGGQILRIRIKDNGTSKNLTYGSEYRAMGVALPAATTAGKTAYLTFIRNATDSKWDLIDAVTEA